MPEYSRFQKGVIKRHYANLETKTLQALQELVSELYLSAGKPKAETLWKRAEQHLAKTDVPRSRFEKVIATRDLQTLADLVSKAKVPDREPGR
ncbi:MAG: hypothetical protein AAF108_04815 [Planctomycetota bacterium]